MQVRLKEIRTLRGLSLLDLANLSGVTESTISRIENHKQEPRPSSMRKLAKALDVTVAELWGEEEPGKIAA